jgi:type II secretion system protein F
MGRFTYIARDRKGERIEGTLEVDDRQAVISRLQTMGYFPIKIEDVTPKPGAFGLSLRRGRVSPSDLVSFNRQLADLVGAGVPLVKALSIILAQTRPGTLHDIIADISKNVQGGDTLAQALQRHPRAFSPLNVAMVRAGEAGGMLDEVLQRLADFSEAEEELKGKVLSSLAYPAVMVLAGTVVIAILLTVVIPKITGVYADLEQTLPAITRLLIAITGAIGEWWPAALVALAVTAVLTRQFLKNPEGRLAYDGLVLRIPIIGEVIHKRELSRFARTLGNLLRNGVPILNALDITVEVVTNAVVRREVEKLQPAISQGTAMATTLGESRHFPPTMVSMVAVGEETAQLDKVLLKVSATYEGQVDRSLKTLTSMLEPLIILVLGVVVGFIVISMLLPIMTLDPTAGE